MTITVNGKESEDIGMLLGPAGEAYFVGEEVIGDNPYDEAYEVIQEPRQSEQKAEQRVRSSSEEPHAHSLQGAIDGAGIDLDDKAKKALEDADLAGGYFL